MTKAHAERMLANTAAALPGLLVKAHEAFEQRVVEAEERLERDVAEILGRLAKHEEAAK